MLKYLPSLLLFLLLIAIAADIGSRYYTPSAAYYRLITPPPGPGLQPVVWFTKGKPTFNHDHSATFYDAVTGLDSGAREWSDYNQLTPDLATQLMKQASTPAPAEAPTPTTPATNTAPLAPAKPEVKK